MSCVRPKERTNLFGDIQSLIYLQAPYGMYIKSAVVEFSLGTIITMNTLALPKDLLTHSSSPFPFPHYDLKENVGFSAVG